MRPRPQNLASRPYWPRRLNFPDFHVLVTDKFLPNFTADLACMNVIQSTAVAMRTHCVSVWTEEDSHRQQGPLRGSSSPLWRSEPARVSPIKLAASAFNRISQYASSPGKRAYCYAELAVSSLAMAELDHLQYSLRLPTERWPE